MLARRCMRRLLERSTILRRMAQNSWLRVDAGHIAGIVSLLRDQSVSANYALLRKDPHPGPLPEGEGA